MVRCPFNCNQVGAGNHACLCAVTIFEAELRMLVSANMSLNALADQIGRGERVGMDAETAMLLIEIGAQLGEAIDMLFARDTHHLTTNAIGRAQRRLSSD